VNTLARTVDGSFKRVQFTPDLLPADLVGTRMYNQKSGEFSTVLGPVFTNLLLADEINRAPAKVQKCAARSDAGAPGHDRRPHAPGARALPGNGHAEPIETEGTYPLPEAQIDRFMMKV